MTESLVPPEPQELCDQLFRQLSDAAASTDHPLRLVTMSTVDDNRPRSRTVVLREVHQQNGSVLIHTDARSTKIRQIQLNPAGCLLAWDPSRQMQIILNGTFSVHTSDATADALWDASPASSLRACLAPAAPGTVATGPDCNLPESLRARIPDAAELQSGRSNFAAIQLQIESMEWLQLHRHGHLRLRLRLQSGRLAHAEWLMP